MRGLLALLGLAAVGLIAASSRAQVPSRSSSSSRGVVVTSLSDVIKRVSVDGRVYVVMRFGGGRYTVVSERNPGVRMTIDQTSEPVRVGDAASLAQLERDAARFPPNLFTTPIVQ